MARTKKNKVFDLFKKDFKITFFYKPSLAVGDEFYYVILDGTIRLKIKVIREAIVIDDIIPLTSTYLAPSYDKLIETLMGQDSITVLISLLGNTTVIQKTCSKYGAPVVEDDRYITVSKQYYDKIKQSSANESEYGFYLLSVGEDMKEPTEEVNDTVVAPHKQQSLPTGKDSTIKKVTDYIKSECKGSSIEIVNDNMAKITLQTSDKFTIEISDNLMTIKEFMSGNDTSISFIKMVDILNMFDCLLNIVPDIYIVNIMNADLYRLCMAKNYELISEPNKIPPNKIFKQVFHGYGTFKITLQNN